MMKKGSEVMAVLENDITFSPDFPVVLDSLGTMKQTLEIVVHGIVGPGRPP